MSAQADALRQLSDFFTIEESAGGGKPQARGPRGLQPLKREQPKPRHLNGGHALNLSAPQGGDREFHPF